MSKANAIECSLLHTRVDQLGCVRVDLFERLCQKLCVFGASQREGRRVDPRERKRRARLALVEFGGGSGDGRTRSHLALADPPLRLRPDPCERIEELAQFSRILPMYDMIYSEV